jgi:hypothetical protein
MKHLHSLAKKAGIIIVSSATVFSLTLASATESGTNKAGASPPPPPAEKVAATPVKGNEPIAKESTDTSKKKVSKEKKKARHNPASKNREAEPAPGARLNLQQVMDILKGKGDFSGKNLSGLHLVGFDLSGCNFKGADLSYANMERANLQGANLQLADLTGSNLMMTDLRLTGLKGARLDGAAFDGAIWQDGTTCSKYSIGYCREQGGPSGSN